MSLYKEYPVKARSIEFIKNHNLSYRVLTQHERELANTDAKRSSDYMIIYDNFVHHEYYWDGKFKTLTEIWKCINRW